MVIEGIETFNQNKIDNEFNKFFTEIGPKLALSILIFSKNFRQFMNFSETVLQGCTLQDEELEEVFNSLKSKMVQDLTIFYHLLLILALVIFLIHSSILLIFQCKQEFFQIK